MKKELLELIKDKKSMKEQKLFIVDTEKVLEEAVKAGFAIMHFFYNEEGEALYKRHIRDVSGTAERVQTKDIEKISVVKTHQGFAAVVKAEAADLKDLSGPLVLLDNIQDPANTGAIIRSGLAFGFEKFLLLGGVFIYGEKTVRASAGNVFKVKYREVELADIKTLKKTHKLFVTDVVDGVEVKKAAKKAEGDFVIVFGNEGQGVNPEILKIADVTLNIPLPGKKVESLNVAAAAAVIFYNFAEGGKK
jgi:TrmH family RNA methyltransferase